MATQAQIDALRSALYSGELRITYDGKTVEYRSASDIERALRRAEAEVASAAGTLRRRVLMTDSPRQKGWSA